jgi:hypothetical protein
MSAKEQKKRGAKPFPRNEQERELARSIIFKMQNGATPAIIARELSNNFVPSPQSKKWSPDSVKNFLRRVRRGQA